MELQANVETMQPGLIVPLQEAPRCCRRTMDLLSRRAMLHGDGEVEFTCVWYCQQCGQMVL